MIYLALLGGVILGSAIMYFVDRLKTGYGYFKIEPYDDDDDGFYTINVCITPDPKLMDAEQIILRRDHSQK